MEVNLNFYINLKNLIALKNSYLNEFKFIYSYYFF